ncbi:MAG: glycosyltransferase [Clostridia bacterium]|nr:glycosyltransferase [Clostridia bacterium]
MKITIICDVLGKANNGTVIATLNLIDSLKEKGHEVTVVSCDKSTQGKEDYYVVPCLNLGVVINKILEWNEVSLAKADKNILRAAIENADAVHLQLPFPLSWTAVKIATELNKPITASFHCQAENVTAHVGLMRNQWVNHWIYNQFYKRVYRYCDAIHYPTEFIKNIFAENTPIDKPAYVISNGVNDEFFEKREKNRISEKFTIVCSGRYSKEKAQWALIDAIGASKHREDIKVVFAGCGPCKKALQKRAKKRKVDCEFEFFSRAGLINLFHGADLYVHTALVEIEAIACMEAIACGLPAVICDSEQSATRFFAVDEKTLFEKNNSDDLRDKIDYFYENRDALEEYTQKYKTVSAGFSHRECMQRMEDMIVSTAAAKEGRKTL